MILIIVDKEASESRVWVSSESGRVTTVSGYPHTVTSCQFRYRCAGCCVANVIIVQVSCTQVVVIPLDCSLPDYKLSTGRHHQQEVETHLKKLGY